MRRRCTYDDRGDAQMTMRRRRRKRCRGDTQTTTETIQRRYDGDDQRHKDDGTASSPKTYEKFSNFFSFYYLIIQVKLTLGYPSNQLSLNETFLSSWASRSIFGRKTWIMAIQGHFSSYFVFIYFDYFIFNTHTNHQSCLRIFCCLKTLSLIEFISSFNGLL